MDYRFLYEIGFIQSQSVPKVELTLPYHSHRATLDANYFTLYE
ncbi:MAG: hypothetical protein N3C57_03955 [Aquificaceae bacterium]|nr:hypothetical protein [Aquificaceae bacterium]